MYLVFTLLYGQRHLFFRNRFSSCNCFCSHISTSINISRGLIGFYSSPLMLKIHWKVDHKFWVPCEGELPQVGTWDPRIDPSDKAVASPSIINDFMEPFSVVYKRLWFRPVIDLITPTKRQKIPTMILANSE